MSREGRINKIKELYELTKPGKAAFTAQAAAMDLAVQVPWLLEQIGEGKKSDVAKLKEGIRQIKEASADPYITGMCRQILKDVGG